MITSVVAANIWYLKMCGFYWATLYICYTPIVVCIFCDTVYISGHYAAFLPPSSVTPLKAVFLTCSFVCPSVSQYVHLKTLFTQYLEVY